MAIVRDWIADAAKSIADETDLDDSIDVFKDIIAQHCPFKPDVAYMEANEEHAQLEELLNVADIPTGAPIMSVTLPVRVIGETPFNTLQRVAYVISLLRKEPPLLQCIECRNTESPAGAMARQVNHGRCLHCGGYFKVIRA